MIDKHRLIGRVFGAEPGVYHLLTAEEARYVNEWMSTPECATYRLERAAEHAAELNLRSLTSAAGGRKPRLKARRAEGVTFRSATKRGKP